MEVAKFSGVSWKEFRTLSYPEKVRLVAFYRVANKVDWVRAVYPNLKGKG